MQIFNNSKKPVQKTFFLDFSWLTDYTFTKIRNLCLFC